MERAAKLLIILLISSIWGGCLMSFVAHGLKNKRYWFAGFHITLFMIHIANAIYEYLTI